MLRKLTPDEEKVLQFLYLQHRIPTDQFKRRRGTLNDLTKEFNLLTERNDSPDDLLHYMINRRKGGKWPRLGSKHEKLNSLQEGILTQEEWKILEIIYLDINRGSDNFAFDKNLRINLAKRFAAESGKYIPGDKLSAAIEARRKEGTWVLLHRKPLKPFSDMDAVAS